MQALQKTYIKMRKVRDTLHGQVEHPAQNSMNLVESELFPFNSLRKVNLMVIIQERNMPTDF